VIDIKQNVNVIENNLGIFNFWEKLCQNVSCPRNFFAKLCPATEKHFDKVSLTVNLVSFNLS
jgi:hypothetical protein